MKTLFRRLELLLAKQEAGCQSPGLLQAIESLKLHIQSIEA